MLQARNLGIRRAGARLLDTVSIEIHGREVHAVLGPNGAGKSSLLKVLSGEWRADEGSVRFNDRPIGQWSAAELARLRAVMPQSDELRFPFQVEEVVEIGRMVVGSGWSAVEKEIVRKALEAAGASGLAGRRYTTLSIGERVRVRLARAMAQIWEPPSGQLAGRERCLLLDEPTASLDLAGQHETLAMARCFAAGDVGIVVVLHDPNLALAYADRVTLLDHGRAVASGAAREVLNAARLSELYRIPMETLYPEGDSTPVLCVKPRVPPARGATGSAMMGESQPVHPGEHQGRAYEREVDAGQGQ